MIPWCPSNWLIWNNCHRSNWCQYNEGKDACATRVRTQCCLCQRVMTALLSFEEAFCDDHLYVFRENGQPHTIMGLLHVQIQTLINISYRGIQLLSTSTYLPLAKVCLLYYISKYSKFFSTLILLAHQLSRRSPQNSPKVQRKGTLDNTLKINTSFFPSNLFSLLS